MNLEAGLSRAAAYSPGHGGLDLGFYADNTGMSGRAKVEAMIKANLAAYGEGWVTYNDRWAYGANAGLRYRW